MCWRNFCNFSLHWWLENVKSRSKIALFSNERHFEIWFPKKRTITFFWSRLSKLHKRDPILHVATTFSLKQGETRTSHGPIPHPFKISFSMLVIVALAQKSYATQESSGICHLMPRWHLPEWREEDERAFVHCGSSGLNHAITSKLSLPPSFLKRNLSLYSDFFQMQLTVAGIHREIVPPRETVAIARVAIAIVGRGGWGSLPYTVANENQMKA